MKKSYLFRGIFYAAGLFILALGITLNTKTGLGVSPIISVSYSISAIWNLNFGNMTLALYGIFVAAEMLLHTIRNKRSIKREGTGLVKNCFDILNISITAMAGMVFGGKIIGIGIGTVAAVIGVGRTISIFNHFVRKKMDTLAGMRAK